MRLELDESIIGFFKEKFMCLLVLVKKQILSPIQKV